MKVLQCLVRGDCVRVLDREPTSYVLNEQPSYIVGIVKGVGVTDSHTRCYWVECFYDSEWRYENGKLVSRVGTELAVPMRMESDFAQRIQKV